jgi:hypothetical protein
LAGKGSPARHRGKGDKLQEDPLYKSVQVWSKFFIIITFYYGINFWPNIMQYHDSDFSFFRAEKVFIL